jgi:hypothetical protein
MNYYVEPEKKIEIQDEVDVLVIGAGPAGVAAAISAARMGVNTMLIEQTGNVGGVATTGLMSHWTGATKGGFYEEILEKTNDMTEDKKIIDPEKLKIELFKMLSKDNVKLKLYTFSSDAIMQDNVIKGVITQSKSGRKAIMAKIVIDATGDGDIACSAGAPYFIGRESDGKMQPVTLMFKVAGVIEDEIPKLPDSFETECQVPKGELQALARKVLPHPAGHVLLYKSSKKGVITCNMTNCIGINGTNADDLTTAHIECSSQMEKILEFLKTYVPGFENCYIISSASVVGVRETRHFIGEKTITEEDITTARFFDDWAVTKAHFNFDIHNIDGSGLDKNGVQKHFVQKEGYTIPYGCFVPKKIDNLLLAGRNISGTHKAHSSYRVMPICVNMGQSAGIAASICVKENIIPRNLDVKKLQFELTK